ncbi:PRC-barrel domain-containing protein [soil metagenome]
MRQTTDTPTTPTLVPLSETHLTLATGPDIRGFEAFDLQGEKIGTVDDLLIDSQSREVRLVKLTGGGILGIGDKTWLIPVEALRDIGREAVRLDRDGSHVSGGPIYQPDVVLPEEERFGPVYDHYGVPPFWVGRVGRSN